MKFSNLEISRIDTNEANPRGIDIPTQDQRLSYLKDSIARFGVMVPVVVTPKGDRFLLVDGERRYYAAKAIGLDRLPAYVITNDRGDGLSSHELLFRMFQIHHLRDPWGPIQQCFSLEETYHRICHHKNITALGDGRFPVKAVAEELARTTGIDERTALDRVKFLRWPEDVKNELYHRPQDGSYWYICEIEEKIIIPALSNYPEYFDKVPVDDVRRDLFKKLNISLERATEVRKVAPYFRATLSKASDKKTVHRILDHLQKDPEMTYTEAQEEFSRAFPNILKPEPPTPRRLLNMLTGMETAIDQFDVSAIEKALRRARATRGDLAGAIRSLLDALQKLLDQLEGS